VECSTFGVRGDVIRSAAGINAIRVSSQRAAPRLRQSAETQKERMQRETFKVHDSAPSLATFFEGTGEGTTSIPNLIISVFTITYIAR